MSKATPGPWTHNATSVWADQKMVAAVYGDDPNCKPDERMRANASLIAAAPELLEALRVAEHSVGDSKALEIVRAAIAKATGGPRHD